MRYKIKKAVIGCMVLILVFFAACSGIDENSMNLPFDEPLAETFNYCPSVIEEEDGTRYVYYCSTAQSGVIQDHIYCRKGTLKGNGFMWSEKTLVLAPRSYTEYFDAFHCCDPSVIEGKFSYKGTEYKYLMAYTGNTSNINNKVGLAVSNSPMGEFVALEEPLVTYSGDKSHWGVGQPTLVSVDKQSTVMLFYSVGSTSTYVMAEKWDFSDMEVPRRLSSAKVSEKGLSNLNGGLDYYSNIDVAYDETTSRYYVVSDCHPHPSDTPTIMSSHFRVTYMTEKNAFGDSLMQEAGKSWLNLATIGPSETGFPRNHNCGIVRDGYGRLKKSDTIEIMYTMSLTGDKYEWTYRIYSQTIAIEE